MTGCLSRKFVIISIWMATILVLIHGGTLLKVYAHESSAPEIALSEFDGVWVYHDMEMLMREGLLKDYPVDWVKAGHTLSRLELSYYIKQVVIYLENNKDVKLSPGVTKIVQGLVLEFQKELFDLGIKTTEIKNVSLNPIGFSNIGQSSKVDSYQDLDSLFATSKSNEIPNSFYYYGQYYNELQHKSFFFIPSDFVKLININILENNNETINILYQPQINSSFLVLKGSLPIESRSLKGYYLFPIEDILKTNSIQIKNNVGINSSIISILDEVGQIQQVDSLFRYNGSINLDKFLKMKVDPLDKDKLLVGNLNQSLTIGGLLIYSNDVSSKIGTTKDFGLPIYNTRQASLITPVDLDQFSINNLPSLQINIQGTVGIAPQTSLFGGFDFLYQSSTAHLDSLWPSDTKASAGVSFHFDDYWTFLTYQSLVNSQNKQGWFSTTSVGVEYNQSITLWLAYQFLKFDNPVLTGALSFRF